ncbi:MAG TPA: sulfatase [Opitutales bacterium]|nr:sulfatase [Opitutales bacterium]
MLLSAVSWGHAAASARGLAGEGRPLNVVLLTLDDMGWGTSGVEGCKVPGVTPNIDRLASQGKLFTHGYVMVPMCGPSRAALLTGRYPHSSGMMGHGKQPPPLWEEPTVKTPSLSTYLHQLGYRTGAILKNSRTDYLNIWDVTYDELPVGAGFHDRNPDSFYQRSKAFIAEAATLGQPFFLYANPIDPHDPWPGTKWERKALREYNPNNPYPAPERRYSAEEVDVPTCLPDLPWVREQLVPYYESMHRGDACIGAILQAIEDSGQADHTLVIFLSDNGMGVPGAKNTLYQHGTRTPIIMKLPGVIEAGSVDDRSIVSAIDLMPTILEACRLPPVEWIEGRSIYNVLVGEKEQADRDYALTTFDYWGDSEEAHFYPQRSIINGQYCYIWNAYVQRSNGTKVVPMFWNDVLLSGNGKNKIAEERIAYFKNRPVEEFFDLSKDPGCWNNLIDDKNYQEEIARFRAILKREMMESKDPERFIYDPESFTN